MKENKSNLFTHVDCPRGVKQESGLDMDWFETFLVPSMENKDSDVSFEYTASDDLHSLVGFDSDEAPRRRKYLEFN